MGQVLSGTLRLVRKIADGGMGSVWLGEHLVLATDVAVKLMSGPWAAVPSARSRFLREARMTANIDSPHVVRVLDCRHDAADEPYIVLELLRGENLEQRVRRHGPLPLSEVVEVVAQTCEALVATHAAGIVHRDLKPENVFLMAGTTTFVKLLDFGVAKPMMKSDCVDVDLLPAGTPQYMSPEQMFEPETTEARSDLFALATVAYFALTRRTPFDADSMQGLFFAMDSGTFPRPSVLRAELPSAVDRWFEKALAHRPEDRFSNAREMADALYDAVREVPLRIAETSVGDAAAEAPPASTTIPTMFELPLSRRLSGGVRKRAIATLALAAAAASTLVWRTSGPEVQEASASTIAEMPDAGGDGPPLVVAPQGTTSSTTGAYGEETAGKPP